MKLITKITLLFLLISLFVFAIGGVMTFHIVKNEVDLEQRRYLVGEMEVIKQLIADSIPLEILNRDEKVNILPLGTVGEETKVTFSDTVVMHQWLKRMESHIKLDVVQEVAGNYYQISLYDLMVENDDIEESVRQSLSRMYILLLVVMVILSLILSVWLFRPFNETLERIQNFRLKDNKPLTFDPTHTKEFAKLNDFISQMAGKVQSDYHSLKEFTENASHELQTPLAIAKGKLDLLLESPALGEEELKLTLSAHQAIQKISKLGRSLSLLTKIENQEFTNTMEVDLSRLVENALLQFRELIAYKNLSLRKNITQQVSIRIDPVLADILISNLLQNAIRHNFRDGVIYIQLKTHSLKICNTGVPLKVPTGQLFERFKKNQQSGESLGLGLAIVKKICEVNNFEVDYRYEEERHAVYIDF